MDLSDQPAAFDAFAEEYDSSFSHTRLGQLLRQRVWAVLAETFPADQHLLELTCGTGEDALWLAKQGHQLTVTDGSAAMVARTAAKAQAQGYQQAILSRQLSLQDFAEGALTPARPFDGAFSNFGGLNTINPATLQAVARQLGQMIRPGGAVVLVLLGPVCLWEIGWHLLHGQARQAVRRFNSPAEARIGPATIPIWYPSARQVRRLFAPWFSHQCTLSLELWTPPSYLSHLVDRWPNLFNRLNQLEARTAHLTGGWGDHYISVLQRR